MKQCLLFLFVSYLFGTLYFVVPCIMYLVVFIFIFSFFRVFSRFVMIVIVIVMLGGDLISWGNCLPGRCSFHGSPLNKCKPCILHGVATDGSEIHAPSVTHCVGQKTSQMCPALGIHVVPSSPCGLVEIFQMHFFGTERRPPVFVGVFLKIFKRTCTHS